MGAIASFALRKAVRAVLVSDKALVAALGGAKIFDEVPRGMSAPFITFGDTQWRDWSTATDRGADQVFVLDIWTDHRGIRQALDLAERLAALLDSAPLTLEGHRLIDLRFNALDTRRDANGRLARASLRFRALTETI
jgi:PAS domain-containing protein